MSDSYSSSLFSPRFSGSLSAVSSHGVEHGHAAVQVNKTVYSYGRYGETYCPVSGQGILRVYPNYEDYIDNLRAQARDVTIYHTNLSAKEAGIVVQNLLKNCLPYPAQPAASSICKAFSFSAEDPRSTYSLVKGRTCVTILIEAIQAARPGFFDNWLFGKTPWQFEGFLDMDAKFFHKLVTDCFNVEYWATYKKLHEFGAQDEGEQSHG
jgi:hypothetical protein